MALTSEAIAADRADPSTDGRAHGGMRDRAPALLSDRTATAIKGDGWMPGAIVRPVLWKTNGAWTQLRGVAMHVNQSNGNLYNWVNRPNAGNNDMSCNFELYKVGPPEQYLPITLTSWCQSNGNGYYISVETEGYDTEPLNDNQLYWFGKIMAYCHQAAGIPLAITDDPNHGYGLIWHGAGGAAWGGHVDCPGNQRKAQRQHILDLAAGAQPTPTPPAPPTFMERLMASDQETFNGLMTGWNTKLGQDQFERNLAAARGWQVQTRRRPPMPGEALFALAPNADGTPAKEPAWRFVLEPGDTMAPGDVLWSSDGRYFMAVQPDGMVALYSTFENAYAISNTQGAITGLTYQTDGNIVLVNGNAVLWSTGTAGTGKGGKLYVQTDGNIVLYVDKKAVWSSGTYGKV